MVVGIYGWFCAESDECLYVGLAEDIQARAAGHLKNLRLEKHKRADWTQWFLARDKDSDSMVFTLLEELSEYDESELNRLEIKWFNLLNPRFYGKQPSEGEKWKHSEETKLKIAESTRRNHQNFSGFTKTKMQTFCSGCEKKIATVSTKEKVFCSRECRIKTGSGIWKKELPAKSLFEEMYLEKEWSIKKIAGLLFCSPESVRYCLVFYSIPIRKEGVLSPRQVKTALKTRGLIEQEYSCDNSQCEITWISSSRKKKFCSVRCAANHREQERRCLLAQLVDAPVSGTGGSRFDS